jgi:hypothetical protein
VGGGTGGRLLRGGDAGPDGLTEIGTGDAPKQGALFLIAGSLSSELDA